MRDPEEERRVNFVLHGTVIMPVPFVPEIRLYTATEVTPLWHATAAFLEEHGAPIPFWAVPWAGGQAVARFILDHPETVRGVSVIDFGTGSGLVAIAALLAGARSVLAVDIDPIACTAARLNAEVNGVTFTTENIDLAGTEVAAEVLLAGDVWYEEAPAKRFAAWLGKEARRGVRVLTGDPGRAYPPAARVLASYDVPTSIDLESVAKRGTHVLEIAE